MGCRVLRDRESKVPYARELSLRGADALQQRKFGEAEQLFVDALRQSPNDERAQWGYSEVLWQRGEHVLATRHMVQAVELSGSNPELLVRLGQMYLEQKDFTNAQAQADAALKTHRNNPAAWALKADLLRADGKLEEAIDCYQRALLYRPDWPEVQVTVAELYRLSHRPQRALATLDRLTDQRSENQMPPRAYLLRGQALADMGERDAALVYLRNATPKVPADQSNLLYEFAEVQYQLGDLVEARLCLGRALQHNPNLNTALRLQTELDRLLEHPIDSKIPAVLVGHTNPR
ncbi:MAG: tetratricopeptide repeat protein [Pirellulaceae bacterium]|nr:tetratricopeptide repeat protein [Pirellulaceae bacterium]